MSPDARFWYIMGTLARPFGAGGGIWSVLFRRSKKSPPPSVRDRISSEPKFRVHDLDAAAAPPNDGGAVLTVTFEMMKKGSLIHRRGRDVRQIVVVVDNSARVVNSGDEVNHDTYRALVKANVIDPVPGLERDA